jgi:GNAT superfamily N-acetyltransferase
MAEQSATFICTPEHHRRYQAEGLRWWGLGDWADACAAFEGMWPVGPWAEGEWRDLYAEGTRYCALVKDGKTVATAGLWTRSEKEWEVIAVGTAPGHRGRGYGKAVVSFVTDEIHRLGRSATITTGEDNLAMLRVIHHLGYTTRTSQSERMHPTLSSSAG